MRDMLPTIGFGELVVVGGIVAAKFALVTGVLYAIVRLALRAERSASR